MGVRVDDAKVKEVLENAPQRIRVQLLMELEQQRVKMENYAKVNRPWTDRTGMARRTLNAYIEEDKNVVRIGIAHGVDYGKHLELEHGKKYAILVPTINKFADIILKSFQGFLGRVRI